MNTPVVAPWAISTSFDSRNWGFPVIPWSESQGQWTGGSSLLAAPPVINIRMINNLDQSCPLYASPFSTAPIPATLFPNTFWLQQ